MTSADPAAAPEASGGSPSGGGSPPPLLPRRAQILLPILMLLLLAATLHRYGSEQERAVSELNGRAMGTTWTVKIAGGLDLATQRRVVEALAARLDRIDALMSTWKEDSELSRFNAAGAGVAFALSAETLAVFEVAQAVSASSQGAFDVTVGPLVEAWGFGAKKRTGSAPSPEVLSQLRAQMGWARLDLQPGAATLTKGVEGLRCDLSAVAKGYAVDAMSQELIRMGYESFLVELGGELRARGVRPEGRAWRVAIQDPDAAGRRIHRVVALSDLSMATSGDYRNYYEVDGRRVSHTLDPRTGEPISHGLASVTVVHREAAWADAWATALNVLGPEAGYLLAQQEGLAAYFLIRRKEGGFEPRLTPEFAPLLIDSPSSVASPRP